MLEENNSQLNQTQESIISDNKQSDEQFCSSCGKPITAILFILTAGGFLIWWIIDIIMILSKNFKDYQGRKIIS